MYKELPDDWKKLFAEKLKQLKIVGDQVNAICPFHNDTRNSFSLHRITSQWKCFAGCGQGNYWTFKKKLEDPTFKLPETDETIPVEKKREFEMEGRKIKAAYTYHNEVGVPLYQVIRYEPKAFRQRRILADGSFDWSLEGIRRYPYKLPEIQKEKDRTLLWVEGEKDVERLISLGCLASTSSGGASGWVDYISNYVPQTKIIIIPDRDLPGNKYANDVLESMIKNKERTIVFCNLPDPYKDVSDYLEKEDISKLKKYVAEFGSWNFSRKNPHDYFKDRNIPMKKWDERGNDRMKFIRDCIQLVFAEMGEFLDVYQPKIDEIDLIAKSTRDSAHYELFISNLKNLLEMKEVIHGLH